jgi:hypothetical protein
MSPFPNQNQQLPANELNFIVNGSQNYNFLKQIQLCIHKRITTHIKRVVIFHIYNNIAKIIIIKFLKNKPTYLKAQ